MTERLTVAEQALLRTQPHLTRLYLSIFKPQEVFRARVNDAAIAKGEQVITFDTVTLGNYLAIGSGVSGGMTLYVGTTLGGKEKGAIFVFGRTSTTITVGENSHIDWADDDYLTVVNYHQIWPYYPRYVQSDTDITVYKIYEIAYTNQNEDLGSFPVMGPNFAGFRNAASGVCRVYYDGSESENVYGTTGSTFAWSFEGGNPTGSTAIMPGWVEYSTPGHYRALLKIRTPSGSEDYGRRHISIYDRPEEGTDVPILKWGMESLSGGREAGGYRARLWVEENFEDIVDGALVVIFADDWYGSTQQSIGGNFSNRESIVFSGYILDGSIDYDYQNSRVSFQVGSPSDIMKLGEAFSVSVEDSQNPISDADVKGGDPWFYLKDLTVKRAIYHYLRWHSSAYALCDVRYVGDDFPIQFFDCNRDSLYDAVNTFIRNTAFGRGVCDRQGALYFEIEAEAINNASSELNTNLFVDNHDWIGQPSITERTIPDISYLEAGGVAYSGSTGTFTPLLAAAPGATPAYRGNNEKISGLALTSQSQLNTLIGNVYAFRNSRYSNVRLDIAGNYRNFDIAPQELVKLSLNSADNYRGISWTQKNFVIQNIDWTYDSRLGLFKPSIDIAEVTQGVAGDSIEIPVAPPDDGFDDNPPDPPPPIPPVPVPPPISGAGAGVYFVDADIGYAAGSGVFGKSQSNGVELGSADSTKVYAHIIVPTGVTSVIIYALIYPGSIDNDVVYTGALDIGVLNGSNPGGLIVSNQILAGCAGACDWIYQDLGLSSSVSAGQALRVTFTRVGGHGSDTYAFSVGFAGISFVFF